MKEEKAKCIEKGKKVKCKAGGMDFNFEFEDEYIKKPEGSEKGYDKMEDPKKTQRASRVTKIEG